MATPLRELLELGLAQMRDYAVVMLDTDGLIAGWFGGAQQVLGWTIDEARGRPVTLFFTEEDIRKGVPQYELELARNRTTSQDDRWHLRKDGSRIWVTGTVTAIVDQAGELRGYVKVMRDRTDQRIAFEERANRLAAAEQALERTTEFLRRLGHELRNPLTPIKNSAYILPRISTEARVIQLAEIIGNQATVIERLSSDLMDVTRLERHAVDFRPRPVDVCALLREQAVAHSFEAASRGVRVDALLPQRPLFVMGDAARLHQAVSNLLLNALKYTAHGGTVWVKATEEADHIAIKIEDTGIGIAPDMLPRIFGLFTQEPRARDAVPGGLGIGLAIVREIAQLHGGSVQARSGGVGKGSEFTLRLPRPAGDGKM